MVITAHPDDESYACAGTLYRNIKANGHNMLVCATYGEKGTSHMIRAMSAAKMKTIRKKELGRVGRLLLLRPLVMLGLPDGQLMNHAGNLENRCLALVRKHRPEVIISFGPDGISGHLDHISVGKAAQAVARRLHIPFLAVALPPSVAKQAERFLRTRRSSGHYASTVRYGRPNYRVAVNASIKKRALHLHESQMDNASAFTGFPQFAVKELLKAEYFVDRS